VIKGLGHNGYKSKINQVIDKIIDEFKESLDANSQTNSDKLREHVQKLSKIVGSPKDRFKAIQNIKTLKKKMSNFILSNIFTYALKLLSSESDSILDELQKIRVNLKEDNTPSLLEEDHTLVQKLIKSFKKIISSEYMLGA
jgi:hypothetical protein